MRLTANPLLIMTAGLVAVSFLPAQAQVRRTIPLLKNSQVFQKPPTPNQPPPAPAPSNEIWPPYACVTVIPGSFNNNRPLYFAGLGPNSNWIPAYAFSLEKDIFADPKTPRFWVKFVVKAGPTANDFKAAHNTIWYYNVVFHGALVASQHAPTVRAQINVKSVRWYWDGAAKEPGLYGEVVGSTGDYKIEP